MLACELSYSQLVKIIGELLDDMAIFLKLNYLKLNCLGVKLLVMLGNQGNESNDMLWLVHIKRCHILFPKSLIFF